MDWSDFLPLLVALLAIIGFPLALRSRKKAGPQKVEELRQHLAGIGLRTSEPEEGAGQQEVGEKRSWGRKALGVIKLRDRNIDSIKVIGVASQYGARYLLDFVVRSASLIGRQTNKKTRMVRKKSSAVGRTVDIEWKGDDLLVRKLNLDYRLEDKLSQADPAFLKGGIWIMPEPKYEYTRITTAYFLPTPDSFEALDIIAKHIKSG